MASRGRSRRAWSLAAVLLLIAAVGCLPAARALEASAAEANPAEASADLGNPAARQAARQAARATDRVSDRSRVRADEQIGARVQERRTERRGTRGGDAGAANHPRATTPDLPSDDIVTAEEEVDGMITQLLTGEDGSPSPRASKIDAPADSNSEAETLPSKTTTAKTVVAESSAMNEELRSRLEAATTAAAEARVELAETKSALDAARKEGRMAIAPFARRAVEDARERWEENARLREELEAATDAAAEARLEAMTGAAESSGAAEAERDAAVADARDQRLENERLRAELEAATDAAAEARLAADAARRNARDAAAKLAVERSENAARAKEAEARDAVWVSAGERSIADGDPIITVPRGDDASDALASTAAKSAASGSETESGSAANARREVWVTVQVPLRETDDSKTSLSSRVVPALVDVAQSRERRVSSEDVTLAKARFVVLGGLLVPGPPTHEGRDPDAVACAAVAVDLKLPAERVQCYGNGTDAAGTRRLVFTVADGDAVEPGEHARVVALLESSRDVEGAAAAFERFAAAHRGAPPVVEFVRHHARLTFAVAVDASAAATVERNFQRSMFERMTSRASAVDLRDVAVHLSRDEATVRAAAVAAAEHSAGVLAAIRRDSSRGELGDAHHFRYPHDVWFTVQVPTNSGADKKGVRDNLLPTLVDIASEGGALPVDAGDIALVRSQFVLVGGIVVPGDPADPTIGATVSLDVICGGLAVDLGISSENIHCYTNGTVSYARDEDDGEYDSNPYGEEYVDDGVDDDEPLSYEDSLAGPDSPPATNPSPPETAEESYEDGLMNGVAEAETDAPSEEDAYENWLMGGESQGEETNAVARVGSLGSGKDVGDWDPNAVHAWDTTFTEDSLPDRGLNVSGTVVVFIVTGMHDQGDFIKVVSAVDLNQYSSAAEFKTAEALTGGRTPVLQFARHHARLTFAVSVKDSNLLDRVMANFRRPEAQLRLTNEMHGRSLIRDVKLKITPPEAYENGRHVDVQQTANATYAGLWTEPLSAVAAIGADPSSATASASRRRDVWATFQIPAAGDLNTLRDGLFPAVANVTGSNLADVAFVDAHFVLIGALALPGVPSASVDDDACGAALAADLGVDASFVRCYADDDVAVPVGNATRSAASLVYAVSGMTAFPAFAAAVARADPNANPNATATATATATSFPRVRALGGGAAPVAQFSRHHAFLTYAVETSNRDAADAVIRALGSDAAVDALAALVNAPRDSCVIRNVAYKLPPLDHSPATDEEAARPPPPPPSPAVAPPGEMREVWFTVDIPPAAWGEDDARLLEKLRPALMRVARSRDALPTLEDAHLDVARAAYVVVAEVDVPRETMDLLGLEQLCAALAVDVGAHAADAKCVVDTTADTIPIPIQAALGAAETKRQRRPEPEPEPEPSSASSTRQSVGQTVAEDTTGSSAPRVDERVSTRKAARREEAARFREEAARRREEATARRRAARDLASGLGVMSEAAARRPVRGVKIVMSLTNVREREDVLAVGAVVERAASASETSGGVFSTTEALSGGVSPEMVHFDAREVITFAVKAWNQHVAQEVRLAMESPTAAEVLAAELGVACEVHDVWIDQPPVGDEEERPAEGVDVASLGRGPANPSRPVARRRELDGDLGRDRAIVRSADDDRTVWAVARVPVLTDPHDLVSRVVPALDDALAGVGRVGSDAFRYVGASYDVRGEIFVPGSIPAGDVPQMCVALATDLGVGARANRARCERVQVQAAAAATTTTTTTTSGGRRALSPAKSSESSRRGEIFAFAVEGLVDPDEVRGVLRTVRKATGDRRFRTVSAVLGGAEPVARFARVDASLRFAVATRDAKIARVVARKLRDAKTDGVLARAVGDGSVVKVLAAPLDREAIDALDAAPHADPEKTVRVVADESRRVGGGGGGDVVRGAKIVRGAKMAAETIDGAANRPERARRVARRAANRAQARAAASAGSKEVPLATLGAGVGGGVGAGAATPAAAAAAAAAVVAMAVVALIGRRGRGATEGDAAERVPLIRVA